MTGDSWDDELLERLRSRDPAASLPPADPSQVARLLEDAMSHDLDTPTADGATEASRDRSPLTWLVAAAAVLVIAGVGAFAFFSRDAGQVTTVTEPEPTVMELSARAPVAGRCAPVSVEILALQAVAFDGTVSSMTNGVVTLDVTQWYRGGDADQVSVQAPPAELQALVQAADFQVGQRYLVSADDGFVTVCGNTAAYSDELAAMYAQAFGG